jgi:hypothetical protein
MFAALKLWSFFTENERDQQVGLHVRLGINLGSLKLVKDVNGRLNALGDAINDAQRIMSFASDNHILVSQSFFEVVNHLSDDYKHLFRLEGVKRDKHVREHTVYALLPPASKSGARDVGSVPSQPPIVSEPGPQGGSSATLPFNAASGNRQRPAIINARTITILAAVVALAAGAAYFLAHIPKRPPVSAPPAGPASAGAADGAPAN